MQHLQNVSIEAAEEKFEGYQYGPLKRGRRGGLCRTEMIQSKYNEIKESNILEKILLEVKQAETQAKSHSK